ncbi:TPA: hypothetical protein U2Q84_004122 [Enterobacter hormaechei]|nr:hypothetical protein [Enterobacter hormaechei]
MNLTNANNELIREVQAKFPGLGFDLFTAGKSEFVSCVVCWTESEDVLENEWNAIQNVIALHFKTESKIARWNVYIAFFCKEKVSRNLKLLIENDKFTARKLIFDFCDDKNLWKEKHFALERLNQEIFRVDLEKSQDDGLKIEYTPSSLVTYLKNYLAVSAEQKSVMIENLLMENNIHENKEG